MLAYLNIQQTSNKKKFNKQMTIVNNAEKGIM